MRGLILNVAGLALTLGAGVTAASAKPQTYQFSGHIKATGLFQGSVNPDWAFYDGARFSGRLVYDASAITQSYDYINSPDWNLTFHQSPILSFSYSIDTLKGAFNYAPPVSGSYAAIGAAQTPGANWTGVDLRFSNYPIGESPQYGVPADGYVGSYYAHSSFLSLLDYATAPLSNTSPEVDLAALFNAIGRSPFGFSVRFSDPNRWSENPGIERIDGIVSGDIEQMVAVASAVPEPATWAMLVLGFGGVGAVLRRWRVPRNVKTLS